MEIPLLRIVRLFLIPCYPVLVDWTRLFGCTIQGKPNKYQTIASMNIKIFFYRGDNPKMFEKFKYP